MKGALLKVLEWICANLETLNSIGTNSYITGGIASFPTVYAICKTVASSVCQPIAYTLLAIFLLLDLYEVTMHLYQQGGGGMAAPTAVLKSVLKFCIVKWLIDNAASLLSGIFSAAVSIATAIPTAGGVSFTEMTVQIQQQIQNSSVGIIDGIGDLLLLFLTYMITWVGIIGITYVGLSRFVQVYFYVALAPIPLSFFAGQHAMQMGISYLRGFGSVCLQSAAIVLALRMYPAFVRTLSANSDGSVNSLCLQIAMTTIILLGTIFGSSTVAKAVLGAG